MANTLFATLKCGFFRNATKISKQLQPHRFLYAQETLGLDTFRQQKQQVLHQMGNIGEKFREKMTSYCTDDGKNMIFTEDLKNMIHLSQSDDDIDLVVKMMNKFNKQNKQLRFGSYVFGPVVMRLFHLYNKPDIALECFTSSNLSGFFDQLITYQILLDLLYENKRYNDVLTTYKLIQDRQIEGVKFPKNAAVLAMAACYKLNSAESLQYALDLWKSMMEAGHFPMRRAVTFCAGLALNQNQPEVAMEIVTVTRNQNYTTVRNIKVAALAEFGRVEDALPILKAVLQNDHPGQTTAHTFNKDVLERVKKAVLDCDSPEVALEFNKLEKMLQSQGHVSNLTLDEQLCTEIERPPMMNNRQQHPFGSSRYGQGREQGGFSQRKNFRNRPGLSDFS